MKKKLLAVLLLVAICMTLVLSSCNGPCEAHVDEEGDGICDECEIYIPLKPFDIIEASRKEAIPTTVSSLASFDFVGSLYSGGTSLNPSITDKLMITTKSVTQDIPAEENGGTPRVVNLTEYRVYNTKTGSVVYSKTAETETTYTEDDTIVSVTIVLGGAQVAANTAIPENVFLVITSTCDDTLTVGVYNLDGVEMKSVSGLDGDDFLTFSDVIYFYTDEYFEIDGVLYKLGDGAANEVCDYEKLNLASKLSGNRSVYEIGDKYYALHNNYYDCIVYDANFNLVKYIEIPTYTNYSRYSLRAYLLGSGNLLLVYTFSTSVQNLTEDSKYDYVTNSTAYDRETFLLSTSTGEMTAIEDLPFHNFYCVPISVANKNLVNMSNLKYKGFNTMIVGNEIKGGKVSDTMTVYTLNDDATLGAQLEGLEDVSAYEIDYYLAPYADKLVVSLPYGEFLYELDGTKIGLIPGGSINTANSNSKWIMYGDALYDYSLNKVYDIPKDYDNVTLANDVLYLSKSFEADPAVADSKAYVAYYVYDGTLKEITKVYSDEILTTSVKFGDSGYSISKTVIGDDSLITRSYTVYSSSGTAVLSVERKNTATETYTLSASQVGDVWYLTESVTTIGADTLPVVTTKLHVAR